MPIADDARTDLAVPFAEKNSAKRLGARWDADKKVWYVPGNMQDKLYLFNKWMKRVETPKPVAVKPVARREAIPARTEVYLPATKVTPIVVKPTPVIAAPVEKVCEFTTDDLFAALRASEPQEKVIVHHQHANAA